jgi:hypothetical protein
LAGAQEEMMLHISRYIFLFIDASKRSLDDMEMDEMYDCPFRGREDDTITVIGRLDAAV